MYGGKLVGRYLRLGLVDLRLGGTSGVVHLTRAVELCAAQGELIFGHTEQLLVEEHLQVGRRDGDLHILARLLEIGGEGHKVEACGGDLIGDLEAGEEGHVG